MPLLLTPLDDDSATSTAQWLGIDETTTTSPPLRSPSMQQHLALCLLLLSAVIAADSQNSRASFIFKKSSPQQVAAKQTSYIAEMQEQSFCTTKPCTLEDMPMPKPLATS